MRKSVCPAELAAEPSFGNLRNEARPDDPGREERRRSAPLPNSLYRRSTTGSSKNPAIGRDADGKQIRRAALHESLPIVARPRGVEPLTPRSVVWCSIQLSYGRVTVERRGRALTTTPAGCGNARRIVGRDARRRHFA